MVIAPVVEDKFHDVGITSGRHAIKEAARFEFHTPLATIEVGTSCTTEDHLGQVVHDPSHLGIALQDGSQQIAVTASDISYPVNPGEIIGCDDRINDEA